ncbi:hypothetical protein MORTIMER_195 [Erwinia phage vB_EamM_Mortimer]|uniref:Uncharacterized protein n=2 Tax=Agricanvirus TaxID=1984776 RepID=A0A2H5BJW5_9CAUD|nr:hypothetical protein MADMEL_192 [Erwinia phage vB_EamM_MadMel]AUG86944.1 hypothetical protein MORTIMER_195 [Erwinia phage vB_EamM_Mortimer]
MQQSTSLGALLDHAYRMGDIHLIIRVGELATTVVIPHRKARHACIALLEFFDRNKVLVQRVLDRSGNTIDITLDDFQHEATIPGYDREHYLKTLTRRVEALAAPDDVTEQTNQNAGIYNPHAGFEKAAANVAQLLTSERRYAFVDHIGSVVGDGMVLVRRSDLPSNVQNVTEITDPRWLSMLVVNESTFERLPAGREVYAYAQATRLGDLINLLGEEGFAIDGISYPWVHIVRKTDVVRDARSVEWGQVADELTNAEGPVDIRQTFGSGAPNPFLHEDGSVRGLLFSGRPQGYPEQPATPVDSVVTKLIEQRMIRQYGSVSTPRTVTTSPLGTPASVSSEAKWAAMVAAAVAEGYEFRGSKEDINPELFKVASTMSYWAGCQGSDTLQKRDEVVSTPELMMLLAGKPSGSIVDHEENDE